MTQNPFETPQAAPATPDFPNYTDGSGSFDIGTCISEGWEATKNNLGILIGVSIVGFICMMFSYITIIGIFLLVPIFVWGFGRVYLNAYDGETELGDLFAGFQQYGAVLGSTLLLMLVFIALSIPAQVLNFAGMAADVPALLGLGYLVSLIITFTVTVRVYLALFYIVDQQMPAIEAVKASWYATSEQKLAIVGLSILSGLIGFAGFLALGFGILITMNISAMMWVSAYRQIVGRPV